MPLPLKGEASTNCCESMALYKIKSIYRIIDYCYEVQGSEFNICSCVISFTSIPNNVSHKMKSLNIVLLETCVILTIFM